MKISPNALFFVHFENKTQDQTQTYQSVHQTCQSP